MTLQNSRYEKSKPGSGICCGKCVPYACIENGKLRQVGDLWDSETKSCFEGSCVKDGDAIEVQYTHLPCPAMYAGCPEVNFVLSANTFNYTV